MMFDKRAYSSSPRGRYVDHKRRAKLRGIDFDLSFEQWRVLWEPYFTRRGEYVMARNGDAGGYSEGNVRIVTKVQNAIERGKSGNAVCGQRHPKAKLINEDISRIRDMLACGVPMTHIAKQFRVSVMVIMGIKTGKYWRHVAHV